MSEDRTAGPAADHGQDPIHVLIVDDHAVVRTGIRSLLEVFDDIVVDSDAANGREALAVLNTFATRGRLPDIAIVDMRMPGMDGVATIEQISARYPSVAVLVLTSYTDGQSVRSAIAAGCRGYLLKDASPDELVSAIHRIRGGEMPIDPAVTDVLARPLQSEHRAIDLLTAREREVAVLLAAGMSNQDIATRLVISERTARTHVGNILAKLNVSSRTQAALVAAQAGLTSGD
jgi:DNA-binding NarL/FixJ family response regulator